MDKTIKQKLEKVERMAGSNAPAIFLIENGKITSGGKEYTREEYEAILAKNKTVITLIDNIPDEVSE